MTTAGVAFPVTSADGSRSTSTTGRAVVADAVAALDGELAAAVLRERDWRRGYLEPYRRMTALGVTVPGAAEAISAAGLASVHERFCFVAGREELPLTQAMAPDGLPPGLRSPLATATVQGGRQGGPDILSVPYRGGRLVDTDLDRQLDAWLASGTAEPSFADAVRAVMAHPGWLDLRDLTVVVLGAGAEMGPTVSLLRWGAHVVAVDLPGAPRWRRLLEIARSSPGRLSVPVPPSLSPDAPDEEIAAAAGADLLTRTPDVLEWLATIEGRYTLGNYVYADGATHVRAAVAIDALTVELLQRRPEISLAFLATPTDVFPVPAEAVEDSMERFARRTAVRRLSRIGTGGRLFVPNYTGTLPLPDGRTAGLNDSLVPQQGPNYALAKRVQRWRALHERMSGRTVSLNVAPATRTRSVVRNRALAAAYAGAHRFGVEVFEPSTSNTLMAALLVHDLRHPEALARPQTAMGHPVELFWQGANHGGLWRNAFAPRSVLGVAVVLGMLQRGA